MKKHYFISIIFFGMFLLTAYNGYSQNVRLLEVKPTTNEITLKNFGSSAQNVSNWWVCSLFVYQQINNLTITDGNTMLMPDATITFTGFTLNNTASDLGIYDSSSFGSSTAMQDFVQWGAGGQGRESVAVSKGIWTAGDFLSSTGPFAYQGNGTENGLGFWITLSIDDFLNASKIVLFPNPAVDQLTLVNLAQLQISELQIFDISGRKVEVISNLQGSEETTINLTNFNSGVYFFQIFDSNQNSVVRKVIVK